MSNPIREMCEIELLSNMFGDTRLQRPRTERFKVQGLRFRRTSLVVLWRAMQCDAAVPDPAQTPAAHGPTLVNFYVCGGLCLLFSLMLLYSKRKKFRWLAIVDLSIEQEDFAWKSDLLCILFFVLSAVGFLLAAVSTQVYPAGANWGIQTSKVVIILAWTCLLITSCGAVQAMCTSRCLGTSSHFSAFLAP